MFRRSIAFFALGAFALAGQAVAADDPVFGYWLIESKRAIVQIAPCGEKACGEIVWLLEPNDESGQPKTDVKNEDESQRSRSVCGLEMLGDFAKEDEGSWEDGTIYNGEDGKTYNAFMEMQDGGDLKVRGYVGISLIGKSQIWTRETTDRGGC